MRQYGCALHAAQCASLITPYAGWQETSSWFYLPVQALMAPMRDVPDMTRHEIAIGTWRGSLLE
jgi:hypothetical protein